MRTQGRVLVALVLFLAAFAWGFVAHRHKVFPYPLLRYLAGREDPPKHLLYTHTPASAVDQGDLARLAALGYLEGTYDPDAHLRGVLLHDAEAASPGLNLYYSWEKPGAQLLTMDGEVVHSWADGDTIWAHVHPLPDGGILTIVKFTSLQRLSRDSEMLWSISGLFHHSLWVEGERIWTLEWDEGIEPDVHDGKPMLSEQVVAISLDGELLERHSVLDMLRGTPHEHLIPSLSHRKFEGTSTIDPLHANQVEVFDGSKEHYSPLFAKGNLLISLRHLNLVMIVDGGTMKTIWVWGPSTLTRPHHPSSLDDGRILVFNNGTEESEILEVDPQTYRVVWSYAPGDSFFTEAMGSVQRLPNGNTLITESGKGYAFEIDRDGNTVWRFANPDVDDEGVRAALWRMWRHPPGRLPF